MLNLLNLNLQSSCKIGNGDSYFNFFTPKSLNLKTNVVCIISYRESLCTIPASANCGTYNIKIESGINIKC